MPREKISNVSMPVRDQQAAKAFYMEKLGFDLVIEAEMPDMSDKWIQLKPSASDATISLVTWMPSMAPGSLEGLVLGTDDIESSRARFLERGVEVSEVTDEHWGRWVAFRDVDGNGWVLVQSAYA